MRYLFQVIYNSNPAMSPLKKDVIAKSSEYNAQYKGWKTVPTLKELKDEELKEAETNQRQSRIKRKQKPMVSSLSHTQSFQLLYTFSKFLYIFKV
jgi:hypothetical protein